MSQTALDILDDRRAISPPRRRSGALIGYLKHLLIAGADGYRHSGGTLLDHLTGVYELLADWGADAPVCWAGLFHSVYGTDEYAPKLISNRLELRTLIGLEAEQLAFCFAHLDHACFLEGADKKRTLTPIIKTQKGTLPVSPDGWHSLCELFAANALEQAPRRNTVYRQQQLVHLKLLEDYLSAEARAAVQNLHDQVVTEAAA